MNIVVVEDETLTKIFIEEVCIQQEHNVVATYSSAEKFLEAYSTLEIDFVFMDINLKGPMDGIQCASTIMQQKKIPSIFITALNDQAVIEESMDSKPITYLIKPADEADIIVALSLAKSHLRKPTINEPKNNYECNGYNYSIESKQLRYQNEIIKLSYKELLTMELLFRSSNNTVSNEAFFETLWPEDMPKESSLRELIYRLRKKVPHLEITAFPKRGYALVTS